MKVPAFIAALALGTADAKLRGAKRAESAFMSEVANEDAEFWNRELQGSGRRLAGEDAEFWNRELQGSN